MIGQLADCLQSAELAFTIREIEDIVWLAGLMDASAQGTGAVAHEPDAAAPEPQAADAGDDAGREPDLPQAAETSTKITGPAAEPLRLVGSTTTGTVKGTTVHVPGVAGTSAPEQFRRALQPFARRVPSRWARQFDEVATAAYFAETGIWMPQFEPVRERCFDLSLVIEDCTSAELRKQALGELANIFRRYSGLRSVSCYRLGGSGALTLSALEGAAELGIEHLIRNDRRHLVMFASDGTSPRWRDGSVQNFLSALGSMTSVSLLQLLPRPAWRHTLTGDPEVELHASRPGEPNGHLQVTLPWWSEADSGERAIPLPVLGFDAGAIGTWARGTSARGGTSMPGILITPPAAAIPATAPAGQSELSAARQVSRYRNMASGAAYQLAVFLSRIDPLTVTIMRLVQRTMLPNAGDGELAEFILGGLVTRLPASGQDGSERLYRFREGVSAELFKALRYSEEETVARQLRRVGQLLEDSVDGARSFDVSFPAPDGVHKLSSWALPFAEVSRDVLRRLGAPTSAGAAAEPSARSSAAARDKLRVLHLTDLYIGLAASAEREELGAPWTELLAMITASGPVDLVCISGDLTWSGSADEFEEVGRFLDATLEALGLPRDRLYVVPGNHDVKRQTDPGPLDLLSLMAPVSHTGITEYTSDHADLIARPQAAYRAWAGAYLRHQSMQGVFADYHITIEGWRVPIRIAGLDTSWLTAVSGPTPALAADQLDRLREQAQEGLLIVLMHHAPGYLKDGVDVVKQLDALGAKLVLHGHHHEQGGVRWRMFSGTGMLQSCGTGMSPRLQAPGRLHLIDLSLTPGRACTVRQFSTFAWSSATLRWQAEQTDHWDDDGRLYAEEVGQAESPAGGAPVDFFIGRHAEMRQLEATLGAPAGETGGNAGRCLLTGPPGVGKTALAIAYGRAWSESHARGRAPMVIRLGPFDRPEEQLMSVLGALSPAEAISQMRTNASLLVIEDVDTAEALDAARRLAQKLPQCPVLVAGRRAGDIGQVERTLGRGWTTLVLGGLSPDESLSVLRNKGLASAVQPHVLVTIAAAFWGNPALLRGAAQHLHEPGFASRLMRWVDADDTESSSSASPEVNAFGFGSLLEVIFDYRLDAWVRQDQRHQAWLESLVTIAYGPLCGAPPSLAAALAGLPVQGGGRSARLDFAELCRSAVGIGLLTDTGAVKMSAMSVYLLRRRGTPAHRATAHARWGQWIASRLQARGAAREPAWTRLGASQAALREWLEVCSLDGGSQLRPHLSAYARSHGPLPAWRAFCVRMLDLLPADAAARVGWLYTAAQLADMDGDLPKALDTLEQCERLRGRIRAPKPVVSLAAIKALRTEILSKQGDEMARPGSLAGAARNPVDSVPPSLLMRPHQISLSQAAIKATKLGRERIGVIVQARQTGMPITLLAYLEACHQNLAGSLSYIVVVDTTALANQIAYRYREWEGGASMLPLVCPESAGELQNVLRLETPQVILTTVQKLRLLQHAFASECVVIHYGLLSSSLKRMEPLPNGRLIVFAHDDFLFRPFRLDEVGHVIAAYTREDAARDGYLGPVTVDSVNLPELVARKGRALPDEALRHVVSAISEDLKRLLDLPFRAVVVADDFSMVSALKTHLHNGAIARRVKVVTAFTHGDGFNRALARFAEGQDEPALLITTPRSVKSLSLDQIDCCYVLAKVSPALQLILESFVNRPTPSRGPGRIVDYASNDWSVLGMPAPLAELVPGKPA